MNKRWIIPALVFLILCLNGCSTDSSFSMTRKERDGVVFYLADQVKRSDEPVFVLCHGLGGSHSDMTAAAEFLYRQGYAVVTMDLYGHEDISYPSDIYIDEIIGKSTEKINAILGILKDEQLCKTDEFGMYGYSLGGMVGFYMTAYSETAPKVLISLASLPDFAAVMDNSADETALKYCAETNRFERTSPGENLRLRDWMLANNPVDQLDQMTKTAIYMVNGGSDSVMPVMVAETFQNIFKQAGGTVELYVNPDGTHSDLGDYHVERIMESVKDTLPPAGDE